MLIFCYYINLLEKSQKGKHEEVTYPCDQCEYAATLLGCFKEHKERTHERIRFPCDQCEFVATTSSNL